MTTRDQEKWAGVIISAIVCVCVNCEGHGVIICLKGAKQVKILEQSTL